MALPFIVQWLQLQTEREFREHRDAFSMPEEMFRLRYRLMKDMARWLCEELRQDPERRRTGTRTATTVEQQVLCAHRFFATGSYQSAIASDEDLATSQSSVSRSIHAVVEAIVERLGDEWIAFPARAQELAAAKEGFVNVDARFAGCIGAVDGTFICIRAPYDRDDNNRAAYFCRKGYYALNAMVVCVATFRITALEPTYPGSVHDAFVWRVSTLSREFSAGSRDEGGAFLLGDSAYPLQPWMLNPIPGAHQARSAAAGRSSSWRRSVVLGPGRTPDLGLLLAVRDVFACHIGSAARSAPTMPVSLLSARSSSWRRSVVLGPGRTPDLGLLLAVRDVFACHIGSAARSAPTMPVSLLSA
ncbi:putative nuclease HARBI1 [Rhipicephalus sanguineus]|uniref:putative nuclease HARBI1 n=1 Tax=Rhipicephalus sanguineus TaxID=34632 RepID=UPI00189337C9|nr:putative nuclease HARBI1 [Rhipicephalus sanguineus]